MEDCASSGADFWADSWAELAVYTERWARRDLHNEGNGGGNAGEGSKDNECNEYNMNEEKRGRGGIGPVHRSAKIPGKILHCIAHEDGSGGTGEDERGGTG